MSEEEHDGEGPDIGAALGRKIGPLPLGVWIAAVVGGIGIAYVVRVRGKNDPAPDPVTPDPTMIGAQPNGVGQGNGNAPAPSGNLEADPQTNEQWGRIAIRKMIAYGYDPGLVDRAVRKYLAGETLTITERALISEALVRIGPPPVPPPPEIPGGTTPDPVDPITPRPPPVDPPAPGPKPKPPPVVSTPAYPTAWKSVTNGKGSSYSTIAAAYKLGITGQQLYEYQLSSAAGRPADTVATLRKRGANLIYADGTTVLPYPKR